jgi:alpha-tubulin suppressor-like RCC1 family protein
MIPTRLYLGNITPTYYLFKNKLLFSTLLRARGVGLTGALGHGSLNESTEFTDIIKDVSQVSAGIGHSAAISNEGQFLLFGQPYDFALTLKLNRLNTIIPPLARMTARVNDFIHRHQEVKETYLTPTIVKDLSDKIVTHVSSSGGLTAALTKEGKIYCVGLNKFGQCGIGQEEKYRIWRPILNVAMPKAIQVDAGLQHCIALTEYGDVFIWGKGLNGQLGTGSYDISPHPQQILMNNGVQYISVAAGLTHSSCITVSGDILIWGRYMSLEVENGKKRTKKGNISIHNTT